MESKSSFKTIASSAFLLIALEWVAASTAQAAPDVQPTTFEVSNQGVSTPTENLATGIYPAKVPPTDSSSTTTTPTNSLSESAIIDSNLDTLVEPAPASPTFVQNLATPDSLPAQTVSTPKTSQVESLTEATPFALDDLSESESDPMGQVTNVSQLRDVSPGDWAYEALRSLVERYGCITGYPDSTFRGNQTLTRYEFAAGLNACLTQLEGVIEAIEELNIVKRLLDEFTYELAILRGRTDALQARTAELELTQFSTTTKLKGEAIFAVSDVFGGESATNIIRNQVDANTNTVFQNRVRLELLTSFSGQDLLRTRLQAGNPVPLLASGEDTEGANLLVANEGRLAFDPARVRENSNSVFLDLLSYSFPIGDQMQVHLFADGGSHYHYADTLNPWLDDEDGGQGAISRFGQRNPIYGIGGDGVGIGLSYQFSDLLRLDTGYLANRGNNPSEDAGLFRGNYSALVQLVIQPDDLLKVGLTYVHAYSDANIFQFGGEGRSTGTFSANLIPLALSANSGRAIAEVNTPVASNSYGLEASYQISPKFAIGGWVGFTNARLLEFGDAEIWNYAVTFAFPDLGKPGNLAALIVGSEPTLKGLEAGDSSVTLFDRDDSLHIEGFYRYQLSDHLSITPGVIWLPSLNQNSANNDVFILTIRTTFNF